MSTFKYQNTTKPLTLKQQRFLVGYLWHGNATRAAREAGFSDKHAASAGSRLLHHPLVKQSVEEAAPRIGTLLPSGLEVAFSYQGRSVAAGMALAISQADGSPFELAMWRAGLAGLCLLAGELED